MVVEASGKSKVTIRRASEIWAEKLREASGRIPPGVVGASEAWAVLFRNGKIWTLFSDPFNPKR